MLAGAIELDERLTRPRSTTRPTPAQAATLYETYQARLSAYVAFRVREPADVEDLTAAWLFRVAHNIVVDHYRRRRFPDPLGVFVDRPDDAPGLPEQAIKGEQLRLTDAALRSLPGRQRAAIYLRYYDGLDYAEVAVVLGVPAATARSLVHRGLKRVARDLGAQEGG